MPTAWAPLFAGAQAVLDTHRGWDAGALTLARELAAAFRAPLFASTTTRLLIDLNRSAGHRQLYSEFTRDLPPATRRTILDRHYRPYREDVQETIARHIADGARVVHLASHSFTPVFEGHERTVDIGWLYDPLRAGEAGFSRAWRSAFAAREPALRLRLNQPYRGNGDGLTRWLRQRHCEQAYLGIELEVSQRFVLGGGPAWPALRRDLIASLATALQGLAD